MRKTYPARLTKGDALDRLSILHIKHDKGMMVAFDDFADFRDMIPAYDDNKYFQELLRINRILWNLEDDIRQAHEVGNKDLIVEMSRDIIEYNRQRAEIKKAIDGIDAEPKKYNNKTI